ncbi:MAG TPA: 3-oxoacyl-ACP reductase FabG [Xanthobacteraceae bacterium]|nr:3-oxoacyl-ACP reductase FabG [Xanthobacteraceae bacterium]
MSEGLRELAGKVAIVTGAGRNIGRAIALDLAAAGAAVVVNARTNRAEAEAVVGVIEQAGGRAVVCLGDVADARIAERLATTATEKFGRIDMLINNAALRRESPFTTMSFEEWRQVTGLILDGAFHCVKAALPHLKRSGAGTIINIGGVSAHTGARDRAHVVTAKAGLVGMTRALAHDLGGDGITVNCVVPGLIDTARASGPVPSHHQAHHTLVGRKGASEEVAAMVRFLCGPQARYITGQAIQVNGGAYMG